MLSKMICVPRLPDESVERHMTRWARLLRNCRAKKSNFNMVTKSILPAASHGVDTLHGSRREIRTRETSSLFLHKKYDVGA